MYFFSDWVDFALRTTHDAPMSFPNWLRTFQLIIKCSKIVERFAQQPDNDADLRYYNWALRTLHALPSLKNILKFSYEIWLYSKEFLEWKILYVRKYRFQRQRITYSIWTYWLDCFPKNAFIRGVTRWNQNVNVGSLWRAPCEYRHFC